MKIMIELQSVNGRTAPDKKDRHREDYSANGPVFRNGPSGQRAKFLNLLSSDAYMAVAFVGKEISSILLQLWLRLATR